MRAGQMKAAKTLTLLVAGCVPIAAQTLTIANDKLAVTVATRGARIAEVRLKADGTNPLAAMGHFLALDGFGGASAEEQKTGMPFHGEANRQMFQVLASEDQGAAHRLTLQATFPLAQETLTRTMTAVNGENIVYVTSELESGLSVDRPISWAEHATIGPPFMEKGKVVVDMPAVNCRVRPEKPGNIPGHLVANQDFHWPMAPTIGGGQADLRLIPTDHDWLDLASCQMNPSRRYAFVTALHLEKHVLYGYVFRREDYPWVMSWMNFTGNSQAARGMEFSSQPFDISHRETVALSPLFGTPTFRWLGAKAKIETRFLLFCTEVPGGFTRIDDVKLEGGKLTIVEHSGATLALSASRGL